ncbi:MAG: hypothetical protein ACOYJF_06505 [Prevotella sp.]|jgi:hypothetical protein
MQQKHWTRQRVQSRRQQKRRHPFDDSTTLGDLVRPDRWRRIDELIRSLGDYLTDSDIPPRLRTGLFFKPSALEAYGRTLLYVYLRQFLQPDSDGRSILRVSKTVFYSYLADSAHSNLGVSMQTIKAAVNKAVI